MTLARRISILVGLTLSGLALVVLTLTASAEPPPPENPDGGNNYPGSFPCNTTLQACIDATAPGDAIFILPGTYVTSVVLTTDVSLIGSGVASTTLVAETSNRTMLISGALVTPDTVISNLTIQGGGLAAGNGAGILVEDGAQPTLENLIIRAGFVGAGSAVGGGLFTESSLTLTDILFSENTAFDGHGGGLGGGPGAHLVLNNVTFDNNGANRNGGGLYADSATISGSTFLENITGDPGFGGGAYISGTVIITDSVFIENGAHEDGGGVYSLGDVRVTGGEFRSNFSQQERGGALGVGGSLLMNGTVISDNTSFDSGGAILVTGTSTIDNALLAENFSTAGSGGALRGLGVIRINNTQFISNSAFNPGGGLRASVGLFLTDTTFISNTSGEGGGVSEGGGLRANAAATITGGSFVANLAELGGGAYVGGPLVLTGAAFTGNTAFDFGGGLYAQGGLVLNDATFTGNIADDQGGGLQAIAAATINGGSFTSNEADEGGGAYVQGTLVMSGTTFTSNIAGNEGGGAYVQGALVLSGTTFTANTAADEGGGLKVFNASIHGAAFYQNQVLVGNGGGLAAETALTITESIFTQNRAISGTQQAATGSGGGLFGDGFVSSTRNTFIDNFAIRLGGGMDADDLQTIGDTFQGNLTGPQGSGGGMFVSGIFELEAGQFIANRSNTGGGLGVNSGASGSIANSLFARNVVTFTDGGSAMRLLSTSNLTIIHNTFVGTNAPSRAAVHMQSTGDFGFFANIFTNFAKGLVQFGTPPTSTATTDHNVFFSVTLPYLGQPGLFAVGAADITGTVTFRDPAADDYHLMPGSIAIDHAPSYGLTTDFEGQQRPIGDDFDSGFDEASIVALSISKTDGQDTVLPGDPLTYTIVVSNAGPHEAVGVVVSDTLPAGLSGISWTCTPEAGSTCPAGGFGSINAEVTVGAGSSVTFTIHVTVDGNASGILVNTASIAVPANTVNTNAGSESATDNTTIDGPPPPPQNNLYLPLVLS